MLNIVGSPSSISIAISITSEHECCGNGSGYASRQRGEDVGGDHRAHDDDGNDDIERDRRFVDHVELSVMDNGAGWMGYRCWHRGKGCDMPRFSNKGLLRGAPLRLRLIRDDGELQAAIRASVERRSGVRQDADRCQAERDRRVSKLETERRKLFELYYADRITPESFHAEDLRIGTQLAALQGQREPEPEAAPTVDQFERVLALLSDVDLDTIWNAATNQERRTLLDEFVGQVNVFADHLEVEVRDAPKMNVALHEETRQLMAVAIVCAVFAAELFVVRAFSAEAI